MPALARGDAERLLRFVAEAQAGGVGDHPFTPELLDRLGRLIEADVVAYSELDRVRRRSLFYAESGLHEEPGSDEAFWAFVADEHPVCVAQQRGAFDALKLSDFLPSRELRSTRLYDVWFKPYGVEYELSVALPSPLWHTRTLMFDRPSGRDFTERDRLVLDLLRPHLEALWQAGSTRRLLGATLAELERTDETEPRGVVILGPAGDVEVASPPAWRLLAEFFGALTGGRLPPELARWVEGGGDRFVRQGGSRELTIERQGATLLLREREIEPALTPREKEVLSWVARGKTNPEIAELLWLAPSTVRKHLENVYAKLGVNSRTAAVTRFLGLLDAEAI